MEFHDQPTTTDNQVMEFHDQPTTTDNLGRNIYAESLAALFLNPNVKSPITVGICGDWGMGKSSLMIQTEMLLLKERAVRALQDFSDGEKGRETLRCDGYVLSRLSNGGKMYRRIKKELESLSRDTGFDEKNFDPLNFLRKMDYRPKHHAVLKSLACMDLSEVRRNKASPMILTVRYNAWHYRNETEAWAGLAVQITKEIERTMTNAQRLSICWRYAWRKEGGKIWVQVFLPCLLASILAGWIAWAAWLLLDRSNDKQLTNLKYGSIPATVVGISWLVFKSVIAVVKPISAQMLAYMRLPDHAEMLGYQQKVIEDITLLKKEIMETPSTFCRFIAGEWCWNWFGFYDNNVEGTTIPKMRAASIGKKPSVLCRFAGEWRRNWFGFCGKNVQVTASKDNLRMLVFVDDLDRCEDSVILKVLSAINLVLATCEIDAILAMDKHIVKRAINRSFKQNDDTESARDLAENYISKIIQLPLDLPDHSAKNSKTFYISLLPKSAHSSDEQKREISVDRGDARLDSTMRQWTEAETNAFLGLMEYAEHWQKLPRECKRFVNYYYLASRIIYESEDFKSKVKDFCHRQNNDNIKREAQLFTWIFVCWGWKNEINALIQNWKGLVDRERQKTGGRPSLATLVNRYFDEELEEKQAAESTSNGTPKKPKESHEAKWIFDLKQEQERRRQRWLKLKEPLKSYDVSWEGILCFQGFRLHCEAGHLS